MRYVDMTVDIHESFAKTIAYLTENSGTNKVSSIIDYVNKNSISQDDANSILKKYIQKYISIGGELDSIKNVSNTISKYVSVIPDFYFKNFVEKPRNSVITLLLVATALAATSTVDNTDQADAIMKSVTTTVTSDINTMVQQQQHNQAPNRSTVVHRKKYTVQPNDTLWSIASKNSPKNIERTNYITLLRTLNSVDVIKPGDKLELPNTRDIARYAIADSVLTINVADPVLIRDIIKSEGDKEYQSTVNKKTNRGKFEPSYQNGKFLPYLDINGNWTIGYGHLLGRSKKDIGKYKYGITDQNAIELLKDDLGIIYKQYDLMLRRNHITNLSPSAQIALFELCFNLGTAKVERNFKNVLDLLKDNKIDAAADILRNSAWASQIGQRAENIVNRLVS